MGDRVSVQFATHYHGEVWKSAVLCHHWGGPEFPREALRFVKTLGVEDPRNPQFGPVDRREPDALMVSFIQYLYDSERLNHSMRVVPTPEDCDNSDNGHFIIWTDNLTMEEI